MFLNCYKTYTNVNCTHFTLSFFELKDKEVHGLRFVSSQSKLTDTPPGIKLYLRPHSA